MDRSAQILNSMTQCNAQAELGLTSAPESRALKDYVRANDAKGAIDYLRIMKKDNFLEEVLRLGFSLIAFKRINPFVIEHVMGQFQRIRVALFEREITEAICDALDICNSDAQGIVEASRQKVGSYFHAGVTATDAATLVIEQSTACSKKIVIRHPFDFNDFQQNAAKYRLFKTARIAEALSEWPFNVGDIVGIFYLEDIANVALPGSPIVPTYKISGTEIIAFGNALADFVL